MFTFGDNGLVLRRLFLPDLVSCQAERESPRLRFYSRQALPRRVIDLPTNPCANATFDPGPYFPFLNFVRMGSITRFKPSVEFVLQVFDYYLVPDSFLAWGVWGHYFGEIPVCGRVYSGYLPKPAFWSQKTRKR